MVPFHFSTLLLTVSPSAMRTAQRAARPLLTHSFGYAYLSFTLPRAAFTLLTDLYCSCPIRLLILRAALRSFLVHLCQHDSQRPLTWYDSSPTVGYIRLRVLACISSV